MLNCRKVISSGKFGYRNINVVESQSRTSSLLNWIEQLISIRKQCPEIGTGELHFHQTDDHRVLIHSIKMNDRQLLFLHNFTSKKVKIKLASVFSRGETWVPVFSSHNLPKTRLPVSLEAFGFQWWRRLT